MKCVVPSPCTCNNNNIQCENKHLSKVPVFTIHNEQFNSIYVDLSYNQLTIIPAYAFTNLSPLNATDISIDLSNNYISNIEPDAFGGIENDVTSLNLHNNYLTYLPLAFSLLSSLRRLNMLRNPLVNFDTLVSTNFSTIIDDLKITIEVSASFPDQLGVENSLTRLDMSYSSFETVPLAVCRLKYLQSFVADYSANLNRCSSSIFAACNHTMPNVNALLLRYDKLSTIPKLATIFPRQVVLNLEGNALQFIESNSFAGLTSLSELDIRGNRLTRIPFAVNKLFNLHHLDASDNQIYTVDDLDFANLQNLSTLFLHHNPLVYISPLAFLHTPLLFHYKS